MRAYIYIYICVCVCVCVCVHIYIYIYMCVCVCVCIYMYMFICMYTYIHVHVSIYTYMHIYIFFLYRYRTRMQPRHVSLNSSRTIRFTFGLILFWKVLAPLSHQRWDNNIAIVLWEWFCHKITHEAGYAIKQETEIKINYISISYIYIYCYVTLIPAPTLDSNRFLVWVNQWDNLIENRWQGLDRTCLSLS